LGVWGLTFGHDVHHPAAYTDHCKNLLDLLTGLSSSQIDRNDIINLIELVGASPGKPIEQIRDDIRAADPKWMKSAADNDSLLAALEFVIRLWLLSSMFVAASVKSIHTVQHRAMAIKLSESAITPRRSPA
jgi:hypothetical protein